MTWNFSYYDKCRSQNLNQHLSDFRIIALNYKKEKKIELFSARDKDPGHPESNSGYLWVIYILIYIF